MKICCFHSSALPGQGRVNGMNTANSRTLTPRSRSMCIWHLAINQGAVKEGWKEVGKKDGDDLLIPPLVQRFGRLGQSGPNTIFSSNKASSD